MKQNGVMNRMEWLKSLKELFDSSEEQRLDKDSLVSLLSPSKFNLQSPSEYFANSSVKALSFREVYEAILNTESDTISWDNIIDSILYLSMMDHKSSAESTQRQPASTLNLLNSKTVYLPTSHRAISQIQFSSKLLYLNLSGNGLKMLDIDFPPLTRVLNLADNLLVYAKFKAPLNHLKFLNLACNRLRTLKYVQSNSIEELFAANNILEKTCDYCGIENLKLIDLANNNIQRPEDIHSNLPELNLEAMNLVGNPAFVLLKAFELNFKIDSTNLQTESQFVNIREIAFQSSNDYNTTRAFSYAKHKRSESFAPSPTNNGKIELYKSFVQSYRRSFVFEDHSTKLETPDQLNFENKREIAVHSRLAKSPDVNKQSGTPEKYIKSSGNSKKTAQISKKSIVDRRYSMKYTKKSPENMQFSTKDMKKCFDVKNFENKRTSPFFIRKKLSQNNEKSLKNSSKNVPVIPISMTETPKKTHKRRSSAGEITHIEAKSPISRDSKTPIDFSVNPFKRSWQKPQNNSMKSSSPIRTPKFPEDSEFYIRDKVNHESAKPIMTPDVISFLSIVETRINPEHTSTCMVINGENIRNKKPYGDPVNAMMIRPPSYLTKRRNSQG